MHFEKASWYVLKQHKKWIIAPPAIYDDSLAATTKQKKLHLHFTTVSKTILPLMLTAHYYVQNNMCGM